MKKIDFIDHFHILEPYEKRIISQIRKKVKAHNLDNISRTNAYFRFYQRHKEIYWSFLAHMVSRNAGWNMCDLEGRWLRKVIPHEKRNLFFLSYERANWLIFHDAFPQLLLYRYSTKKHKPMFHLLNFFGVSSFMEREWFHFWSTRDRTRLLIALIINEQNVIHKPVIQNSYLKDKVFQSTLFLFQDYFHFSSVLFPTMDGRLFGASVNGFRSLDKRIDLGKRLASILFHKQLYPIFYDFAKRTVHTGSRYDYEQYFTPKPERTTPFLRTVYPVIKHDLPPDNDWSEERIIKRKWFSPHIKHYEPIQLTTWYKNKQKQLHSGIRLKEILIPNWSMKS